MRFKRVVELLRRDRDFLRQTRDEIRLITGGRRRQAEARIRTGAWFSVCAIVKGAQMVIACGYRGWTIKKRTLGIFSIIETI